MATGKNDETELAQVNGEAMMILLRINAHTRARTQCRETEPKVQELEMIAHRPAFGTTATGRNDETELAQVNGEPMMILLRITAHTRARTQCRETEPKVQELEMIAHRPAFGTTWPPGGMTKTNLRR